MEKIKEEDKKLTSYKAVKALELKEGEFEKTSTMKIKRYKELNKKKDSTYITKILQLLPVNNKQKNA